MTSPALRLATLAGRVDRVPALDETKEFVGRVLGDRLQREAGARVSPESFTHGSSAQRVRWFRAGLDTGKVSQCNTFETARP